jgi:hypothetical protein
MEGEVLILPTQPIEIFEEGHLRKLDLTFRRLSNLVLISNKRQSEVVIKLTTM